MASKPGKKAPAKKQTGTVSQRKGDLADKQKEIAEIIQNAAGEFPSIAVRNRLRKLLEDYDKINATLTQQKDKIQLDPILRQKANNILEAPIPPAKEDKPKKEKEKEAVAGPSIPSAIEQPFSEELSDALHVAFGSTLSINIREGQRFTFVVKQDRVNIIPNVTIDEDLANQAYKMIVNILKGRMADYDEFVKKYKLVFVIFPKDRSYIGILIQADKAIRENLIMFDNGIPTNIIGKLPTGVKAPSDATTDIKKLLKSPIYDEASVRELTKINPQLVPVFMEDLNKRLVEGQLTRDEYTTFLSTLKSVNFISDPLNVGYQTRAFPKKRKFSKRPVFAVAKSNTSGRIGGVIGLV